MVIFLILTSGFFLVVAFYIWIYLNNRRFIYSLETVPSNKTVLVLGAGLEKNGRPSDILLDRLISTRDLIFRTSPDFVILSGAESPCSGNEPKAMAAFLSDEQVDRSVIMIDDQGQSTFHSLINVQNISTIQPITIISQKFHLARALMISRILGLQCVGLAADNMSFATWKIAYWYFREILATPFNIAKIICFLPYRPKQKS